MYGKNIRPRAQREVQIERSAIKFSSEALNVNVPVKQEDFL